MKIKKVETYSPPKYPSKKDFHSYHGSIEKYIPTKWKSNKLLLSVLAMFTLVNKSEFKTTSDTNKNIVQYDFIKFNENKPLEINNDERKKLPIIAPLFIHGSGRGATGCVVINPPTFLSEEEARQIIEEELMKENIIFDMKNYKIDEAAFKSSKSYLADEPDTVNIDAYSSAHKLGYEFISEDDYFNFGGEWSGSSVTSYDLIEAAENLRAKMKEDGKISTAIFYDPMERNNDDRGERKGYEQMLKWENFDLEESLDGNREEWELRRKENIKKSVELLKRQISDFIEWAKRENIISNK